MDRARLLAGPVAAGLLYLGIDKVRDGPVLLATVPAETRESFFVSLSATSGALLGFAIAGLTILLTLGGGPRMDWLREDPGFRAKVRTLFITAIASLGLSTVAFLFLLVVATDMDCFPVGWGCLTAALVTLIIERLWRLVSFFNHVMPIALKDADKKPLPNPPMTGPADD
ncbi:MAG TPA: hypothetical protein VN752_07235 [Solirubrobacterales bacterium]|nr:hypothetical protein [Solirubrobacterales bacterium]